MQHTKGKTNLYEVPPHLLLTGWGPHLIGDSVAMTHRMTKKFAAVPCRWNALESITLGYWGKPSMERCCTVEYARKFPTGMMHSKANLCGSGRSCQWRCAVCFWLPCVQEPCASGTCQENTSEPGRKALSPAVASSTVSWQGWTLCQMAEEKGFRVKLHFHRAGNKDGNQLWKDI